MCWEAGAPARRKTRRAEPVASGLHLPLLPSLHPSHQSLHDVALALVSVSLLYVSTGLHTRKREGGQVIEKKLLSTSRQQTRRKESGAPVFSNALSLSPPRATAATGTGASSGGRRGGRQGAPRADARQRCVVVVAGADEGAVGRRRRARRPDAAVRGSVRGRRKEREGECVRERSGVAVCMRSCAHTWVLPLVSPCSFDTRSAARWPPTTFSPPFAGFLRRTHHL